MALAASHGSEYAKTVLKILQDCVEGLGLHGSPDSVGTASFIQVGQTAKLP